MDNVHRFLTMSMFGCPRLTASSSAYMAAQVLALVLALPPGVSWAADAPVCEGEQRISDAKEFEKPPPLCVLSVEALDVPVQTRAMLPAAPTLGRSQSQGIAPSASCPRDGMSADRLPLVGSGVVIVGIGRISYDNLRGYETASGKRTTLFVNGVELGASADLVATRMFPSCAQFAYRIGVGPEASKLWRLLYDVGDLTRVHDLDVRLGWSGRPALTLHKGSAATLLVSITDSWRWGFAMCAVVALVACTVLLAWRSDALRDASTPSFYAEALRFRRDVEHKNREQQLALRFGMNVDELEANRASYESAGEEALTYGSGASDAGIENQHKAAFIGLALRNRDFTAPRPSFSLARVQFTAWFVFSVACAIYLWIVFGVLPSISGSALALLGITVGTSATSVAIDQSGEQRPFRPSLGLVRDLTTGFNDRQLVHRYQSIVVNLMLLMTGFLYVLEHLSFPVFESTWLAFLGLSGAALTIGKQLTDPPAGAEVGTAKKPVAGARHTE